MSTRSAIARANGDGFKGVYHHWDGYPTCLGKTLWDLHHGHFEGDLGRMLQVLINEHPAGWSTINSRDFSLEPGFIEMGHGPCAECGRDYWEHYYQEWERHGKRLTKMARAQMDQQNYLALGHSYHQGEYHNPNCYCHGDRHEEANPVDQTSDQGIEWAYVFDEAKNTLAVLMRVDGQGERAIGMFGVVCAQTFHWSVRGVFDLQGEEPDWEALENGGHEEEDAA